MAYKHRRRMINYLVEGISGTGKSSVYDELTGRGYSALSTDRSGKWAPGRFACVLFPTKTLLTPSRTPGHQWVVNEPTRFRYNANRGPRMIFKSEDLVIAWRAVAMCKTTMYRRGWANTARTPYTTWG